MNIHVLESWLFLECLNRNLLAILGLKEVHDSKITLPEFLPVMIVLIVNRDSFSLNTEIKLLGLRLLPHQERSNHLF